MVDEDPVITNPEHYRTLFENEYVRVLDYTDAPHEQTTPHTHPNSVLVALTDFERRLHVDGRVREVAMSSGQAAWLPAQRHTGENVGTTPTHTILIELKGAAAGAIGEGLGPVTN
jgi:quercetin dioxygenase-like cupin family protein